VRAIADNDTTRRRRRRGGEGIRRRDSLGCSWALGGGWAGWGGVERRETEQLTENKKEREDAGPNRRERVRRGDEGGL